MATTKTTPALPSAEPLTLMSSMALPRPSLGLRAPAPRSFPHSVGCPSNCASTLPGRRAVSGRQMLSALHASSAQVQAKPALQQETVTYVSQAARNALFSPATESVVEAEASVSGSFPSWLNGSLVTNGGGNFEGMQHLFDGFALLSLINVEGSKGRVTASQRFLRSDAYTHFKSTGRLKYREFNTPVPSSDALEYATNLALNVVAITTKQGGFTDNASVNLVPVPVSSSNGSSTSSSNGSRQQASVGVDAGKLRLLAMSEPLPSTYLVDGRTGATLAPVKYSDGVPGDITSAHPKVLPDGRLVNFSRSLPFGGFHVYLQDPSTLERKQIAYIPDRDPTSPAWVHDLAATHRHAILFEMPIYMNMGALMLGGQRDYTFMDWKPQQGVRVHVVALDGSGVTTYKAPTFFTFHIANAYEEEDGSALHVDFSLYDDPQILEDLSLDKLKAYPGADISPSYFRRLTVPLKGPAAAARKCEAPKPLLKDESAYGRFAEFPAVNPEYRGRPYRYLWGTAAVRPTNMGNALVRHDLAQGSSKLWHERGAMPTEPVFVARPGAQAEDDGVLVSLLACADGSSALVCLDARTMTEVARAALPVSVPYRFHGTFVPSA